MCIIIALGVADGGRQQVGWGGRAGPGRPGRAGCLAGGGGAGLVGAEQRAERTINNLSFAPVLVTQH